MRDDFRDRGRGLQGVWDGPRGSPYARGGPGFRGAPPGPRDREWGELPQRGMGPPGPSNRPGPPAEPFVLDREKICPLLIRVFIKPGGHHRLEDFKERGKEPSGDAEIQV